MSGDMSEDIFIACVVSFVAGFIAASVAIMLGAIIERGNRNES